MSSYYEDLPRRVRDAVAIIGEDRLPAELRNKVRWIQQPGKSTGWRWRCVNAIDRWIKDTPWARDLLWKARLADGLICAGECSHWHHGHYARDIRDIETRYWVSRCRSGKRFFWCIGDRFPSEDHERHEGYAADEAEANALALAIIKKLTGTKPARVHLGDHGSAAHRLKELNKAKRAARPASKAKGTNAVQYLYGRYWYDSDMGDSHFVCYRFQVTRKTKKRIFYSRKPETLNPDGTPDGNCLGSDYEDRIGFVDRQVMERDGEIRHRGRHWSDRESHLYATFEACVPRRGEIEEPDLLELKAAMAAAHPDKGGTSKTFIAARERYLAAKARQRGGARL
jgi:hypothetical protein